MSIDTPSTLTNCCAVVPSLARTGLASCGLPRGLATRGGGLVETILRLVTPRTLLARTRTKLALRGRSSRVNTGRILVGVSVPEKKPPEKGLKKLKIKPMKAAGIKDKNNKLTHCPEPDKGCLTEESGKY